MGKRICKRWSERENKFLLEHSEDMNIAELTIRLKRSRISVTEHAYMLDIKLYQKLTPRLEELIISNIHLTNKMIASELNISESLVETTLAYHEISKDIYIKDINELSDTVKTYPYRRIMEKHLNRKLKSGEQVHHIDMDKTNNDITNLYLCNLSSHQKSHGTLNKVVSKLMKRGIIKFTDGEYVIVE